MKFCPVFAKWMMGFTVGGGGGRGLRQPSFTEAALAEQCWFVLAGGPVTRSRREEQLQRCKWRRASVCFAASGLYPVLAYRGYATLRKEPRRPRADF